MPPQKDPAKQPEPAAAPPDDSAGPRLDALEAKVDQLASRLEEFLKTPLPSPEVLDELDTRVAALEAQPEPGPDVIGEDGITDRERARLAAKPPRDTCPECGAIAGTHFDDCTRGYGDHAMPKTAAEREQVERARKAVTHA